MGISQRSPVLSSESLVYLSGFTNPVRYICCLTLKLDFFLFHCRKCNSSLWQWLGCDCVAASPPSSDHHCHHHHSLPGQEQAPGASRLWEWNPHSRFTTLCKLTGKRGGPNSPLAWASGWGHRLIFCNAFRDRWKEMECCSGLNLKSAF